MTQKQTQLRNFFGALTCVISILMTLAILWGILSIQGSVESSQAAPSASLRLTDQFDNYVNNQISDALVGIQEIKKTYFLNDSDLVAPTPNPACYGQVSTPEEIEALLSRAAGLLDGQTCYFSPETELKPDTAAQYYLDDTILAITWKEIHGLSVYTFSEVKIAHPSQFRRFLSGGEYGSGKQVYTSEMAQSVHAVVAANGDFYGYRDTGTCVYGGKVYREDQVGLDTLMIDEKGDFRFVYTDDFANVEEAQAYVDEHQVRFSLSFGPVLIDNGEPKEHYSYPLGEVAESYARAGICQMDTCHYILCLANYEQGYYHVPTMNQFTKVLAATGCSKAYALDGGQTGTIVMDGKVINSVSYGNERRISDIIYFATALPES